MIRTLTLATLLAVGAIVPQARTAPLQGTLQKIAETNEIAVSYRDSSIPFSYVDENEKPVGYALEICLRVADAAKKAAGKPDAATRLNLVTSATRIPLLLNGTIDLECGSTTNTVDRQKQVDFSMTYFVAGNSILTKKTLGINGLDDLKGKAVASAAGTTNLRELTEINQQKRLGMDVVVGKDLGDAFLLLESGRASALIMDDVLLASLAAYSWTPDIYIIVGEPLSVEPYAIMLRKGDPQFKA